MKFSNIKLDKLKNAFHTEKRFFCDYFFQALVISLFPGGQGNGSTVKPTSFIFRLT